MQCWGDNADGQLGLGDTVDRGDGPNEMGVHLPAVDLGVGKRAAWISGRFHRTCAGLVGGGVKCWGRNEFGALGLGDTVNRGDGPGEMGDALPSLDLGAGLAPLSLTMSYDSSCALLGDGSVKCFGGNYGGQLGLGDIQARGDQPGEMGDALPRVPLFSDTL